jgi:hypothetical protein
LALPIEYFLRSFEIEVVEPVESLVDQGCGLSCQTTADSQEQSHPQQLAARCHSGVVT